MAGCASRCRQGVLKLIQSLQRLVSGTLTKGTVPFSFFFYANTDTLTLDLNLHLHYLMAFFSCVLDLMQWGFVKGHHLTFNRASSNSPQLGTCAIVISGCFHNIVSKTTF